MKIYLILFLIAISVSPEWKNLAFNCDPGVFEIQAEDQVVFQEIQDVPFSVVEEVPVFPGCEESRSNHEKKICFSENVQQFLTDNFNTGLSREVGLTGAIRILGQFRVDSKGKIHSMGARSPHPALSEELERVINLLPQMIPGKQRGKPVGVLYSLPFSFTT